MNHISRATRRLCLSCAAMLLAALALYCAINVLFHSYEATASAALGELSLSREREKRSEAMAKLLLDVRDSAAELDRYVVAKDAAPSVIATLEDIGRRAGVPLDITSAGFAQRTAPDDTLAIAVSAEGPWTSLVHALSLMESVPLQSRIAALSLDSARAHGTSTAQQWSMTASVEFGVREGASSPL